MTTPLVSICVPTYNRASSLRGSLKSICGQDYTPVEILISDNGSNDETEQVCLEAAHKDPRIRYVRHPQNIGLYGNHNFCIDNSKGEFLCFFHDHDERDLRIVSIYVSFLQQHPDVGVVCSDWDLIDDNGGYLGVRDYQVDSITPGLTYIDQTLRSGRSSIGAPGAMIRRSALGDTIRFDEQGPIGFGDFVVWFQIAEKAKIGHIHERLWSWRQHPVSQSARTIESLTHDYDQNLTNYCDAHLSRWPARADLVDRWKMNIRQYIFWALAYEIGLSCRRDRSANSSSQASRTLFEILDYRLTPEEFQRALQQLQHYCTGLTQGIVLNFINILVHLRFTLPLGWISRFHTLLRRPLRLM